MFHIQAWVVCVKENVLGNDAVLEGHNTLYACYLILSIPPIAPSPPLIYVLTVTLPA